MRPGELAAGDRGVRIGESAPTYRLSARTRRLVAWPSQAHADGSLSEADIAAIDGIILRQIER